MSDILQVPGCTHPCGHDRMDYTMDTVYTLWVSSSSFQLLAEVNEPAEAGDNNKIIMVNSCVAFGCT